MFLTKLDKEKKNKAIEKVDTVFSILMIAIFLSAVAAAIFINASYFFAGFIIIPVGLIFSGIASSYDYWETKTIYTTEEASQLVWYYKRYISLSEIKSYLIDEDKQTVFFEIKGENKVEEYSIDYIDEKTKGLEARKKDEEEKKEREKEDENKVVYEGNLQQFRELKKKQKVANEELSKDLEAFRKLQEEAKLSQKMPAKKGQVYI